jgi:hypothetical protein
MPKFEVLVMIHGWGRTTVEADTEEQAREMFCEGEYELDANKADLQYELETIEPEGAELERLQQSIDAAKKAQEKED